MVFSIFFLQLVVFHQAMSQDKEELVDTTTGVPFINNTIHLDEKLVTDFAHEMECGHFVLVCMYAKMYQWLFVPWILLLTHHLNP